MHHFDRAAGEPECHGPEGTLSRPVGDLVHGRSGVGRISWGFATCRLVVDESGVGGSMFSERMGKVSDKDWAQRTMHIA